MQHVQQVRRGDVAHVEGRVLAQPDHVELGQIDARPRRRGRQWSPVTRRTVSGQPRAVTRPSLRRRACRACSRTACVPAPAPLPPGGSAVGVDVDRPDRVHLEGDLQRHVGLPLRFADCMAGGPGKGKAQAEKAFSRISTLPVPSTSARSKRASVSVPAGSDPRNISARHKRRAICRGAEPLCSGGEIAGALDLDKDDRAVLRRTRSISPARARWRQRRAAITDEPASA